MDFTSAFFLLLFLPISIAVVLLSKGKGRSAAIFVCSVVVYAWCGLKFLAGVFASSLRTYWFGILVGKHRGTKKATFFLMVAITYNVLVLLLYKYIPYYFGTPGFIKSLFNEDVTLPMGLSFYTFSMISYLLDVYWEKCEAQKKIINLFSYILFFPKVVQGPVTRYVDFVTQLNQIGEYRPNTEDINIGLERFIKGMFKKVMIADCIQPLVVNSFSNVNGIGTVSAWTGILAYMLQLYYDFSGYSDMAIGISRIMGIRLPENFDHPFTSFSVSEYWRRWHITLGKWFADYLYMPCFRFFAGIGFLPKEKKKRKFISDILALLITWALIGIWHGCGGRFLIYGLWFFPFIVFERVRDSHRKSVKKKKGESKDFSRKLYKVFDYILTFAAVVFGMVIFRSSSMSEAIMYWRKMVTWSNLGIGSLLYTLNHYMIFAVIMGIVFALPTYSIIKKKIIEKNEITLLLHRIILMITAVISFSYAISSGYSAFLYEVF